MSTKTMTLFGCLFFAAALFSAEIYKLDATGKEVAFGGKKIYAKDKAIHQDSKGTPYYQLAPSASFQIEKMVAADAEALKQGNFSIKAKLRLTGKNGHIYLFGIGAGAGDEGIRIGFELRDGKIIPYATLNFTTAPKKYKVCCIAAKNNDLVPGQWFNLAVVVNRTGKMALFVNGVEKASYDISEMAENNMECFGTKNLAALSAKSKSYMQFAPLVLEATYDAGADIASLSMKQGLISSVELKKDQKP